MVEIIMNLFWSNVVTFGRVRVRDSLMNMVVFQLFMCPSGSVLCSFMSEVVNQ
jgi:hypothetical protein